LQFLRFRFDGLEDMEIKQLKISYTFSKKVKFHFKLPLLKASAHYLDTDTLVNMLKQLGLSVRYESSGPLSFSLMDLSIQGEFKYKMPFIFSQGSHRRNAESGEATGHLLLDSLDQIHNRAGDRLGS